MTIDTLYEKTQDGKLVELFGMEKEDLNAGRLRLHKQPGCRIQNCQNEWYLSDRKVAFHERKKNEDSNWKMPSSCPEHRTLSKLSSIAYNNREKCEQTGKRMFKSKEDADLFAAAWESNGNHKQFAYECDKCDGFHLSSLSPEQQREIQERKNGTRNGSMSVVLGPALEGLHLNEDKETQACRMYQNNIPVTEIAENLKLSVPTIYSYLKANKVTMKRRGRPSKPDRPEPATVTSRFEQPDLDATEAELLRQLEEVKKKKKLMEEAKRLRVEKINSDSLRITKEGEKAILPMSELEPLINMLTFLRDASEKEETNEYSDNGPNQ